MAPKKEPAAPAPESTEQQQPTTAVAPIEKPKAPQKVEAGGYAVERDVGTGFEDFNQNDFAVPFVSILQKGNPQVEEGNPARVEGALPSNLINTVTNQLYSGKDGIRLIPVHRHRQFIEWIPKDDGGGLVAVYEPEDQVVRDTIAATGKAQVFGKMKVNDNNDLVETFNVYCLLVPEGSSDTAERVVLSLSSSQIGPYKKWMTQAMSIQVVGTSGRPSTPPLFSHVYRARTEFNKKGEYTWYKWRFSFDGKSAADCRLAEGSVLYEMAKDFRKMVISGAAKVDYTAVQQEGEAGEGDYNM